MIVSDFIDTCVDKGYGWYEGEQDGKNGFFVGCEKLGTAVHFTIEAIKNNEWPILERGIKQGRDVHHMTRIVGYYSRVENWNKSKKAELNDRQKGNYKIE